MHISSSFNDWGESEGEKIRVKSDERERLQVDLRLFWETLDYSRAVDVKSKRKTHLHPITLNCTIEQTAKPSTHSMFVKRANFRLKIENLFSLVVRER